MKAKRIIIAIAALLVSVVSFGQNDFDKVYFKDGSVKMMDIRRDTDKTIVGFYHGEDALTTIYKSLLLKTVYRDGREVVYAEVEPPEVKEKKRPEKDATSTSSSTMPRLLMGIRAGIPFSSSYAIIPLDIAAEVPIVDLKKAGFISLGARGGFARQKLGDGSYMAKINQLLIEATVGYHFPIRFFDVHANFGGGWYHRTSELIGLKDSGPDVKNQFGISMTAGASYYFIPAIGVTADLTFGPLCPYGAVSLGVAVRL